jgi:hypothetical protein
MAPRNKALMVRRAFREELPFTIFTKSLRLFCTHCDKHVPLDMPWKCGHCDKEHVTVKTYSFVNRCELCQRAPKAFLCPHCDIPNFFDKHQVATHPATPLKSKAPEPVEVDPQTQLREVWESRREELEIKLEFARLEAEIEKHGGASPAKKIEKEIEAQAAIFVTRQTVFERLTIQYREKFAGNPNALKQALAYIQRMQDEEALD